MLRLLPWWVFIAIAGLVSVMAVSFTQEYMAQNATLEEAIAYPPETIVLGDLVDAPEHGPISEIAVRDFASYSVGVLNVSGGRAFLVLESFTDTPVFLALMGPTSDEVLFEHTATAIQADWDNQVVRAVLTEDVAPSVVAELREFVAQDTPAAATSPFIMAEFLHGDRAEALEERVEDALTDAILTWCLAVVFVGVAGFKLRLRSRRMAATAA